MSENTMDKPEPAPLSIEDVEALLAAQFPPAPEPEPFPGDPAATWVYWSPMDTAERGVPDEWVLERLRLRRNQHLAETDATQSLDNPTDRAAWAAYRQALRDLPASHPDPRQVTWPEPPTGTDAAAKANDATIRSAAVTALANNADFLALGTPTNAQTLAQVRALTRQTNGLIRLVLGKLDGAE